MIPAFDADGLLPPGVHRATLAEVRERFGSASELRRVQMQSVEWMLDLAARAGVERVVLNGSFVTDTIEPNDVDCALLVGPGGSDDPAADDGLEQGLPFLDITVVGPGDFAYFVDLFFAADCSHRRKGMIEVIGWN